MKKRYLAVAALLALGVCLVIGVLALLPQRPGLTKANFDRIKKGMTEAEVDAIFGPEEEKLEHFLGDNPLPQFVGKRAISWEGPEGDAHVMLDKNGRVEKMEWHNDSTFFDRLLRSLWLN